MLRIILFQALVLSAEYCNGQRRWAGSYSDTYSPEEKMTWSNRNYPKRDIEASTEVNINYSRRWPADKWEGEDAPGIPSPHGSPPRGDERGARRDEKSRVEASQGEKRTYQTPPEERRIQPPPDQYSPREVDKPVIVEEREYRLKAKVPEVGEGYDSRQNTRNYKGDIGEVNEELPQDRNQRRLPSPPIDRFGNRREDRNYKGYEEHLTVRTPQDNITRPPVYDYARPRHQARIAMHEDGKEDSRPIRDDRHKQNSGYDSENEKVGFTTGGPKREVTKIDESQNSRRERNNKDGIDAVHEEIPQGRRQEQYHPKEDYDNRQTSNSRVPGRYRPESNEGKLAPREYIRSESQPRVVGPSDGDAIGYQDKGFRKEQTYGIEVTYTGRYNRSTMDAEQPGKERFIPTYNKGHVDDDNDETRKQASEYDRRREEEMKQREYERRLEEEMKRKQEEAKHLRIKGAEDRRAAGTYDSEIRREEGRGMRHKLDEDMKTTETERSQEKYGTENTRTETNRRIFAERRDDTWLKGIGTEEKNYRAKDEEQIGDPPYVRQENERRRESIKGDLNREDRVTTRTGIIHVNTEQTKVYNSEGIQADRTEEHGYNRKSKGEAVNRESDHTVKRLHYNPSLLLPGAHSGQKTADATADSKDLHQITTTESGSHSRQYNSRNRAQEYSTERSDIQGNQRSQGRSRYNRSNQQEGTVHQQRAFYARNSEESADRVFKSTFSPLNSEANDHRRRYPSREDITGASPSYNERGGQNTGDLGGNVRYNRPTDQTRLVSTHPSVTNSKSSGEQPTRNGTSWKPRPSDNWKTISNSSDVNGYHPNVSYDAIVFLDDENDDETDVWNLSGQQDKGPNRAINIGQDEQRRGFRTPTNNARDSRGGVTSGATELRQRDKRAPIDYAIQEMTTEAAQLQISEPDDIHPDVELLPGYTVAQPFGHRNYNDEISEGEVDIFSETEIRVSAKDYKRYGAIIFNRNTTNESGLNNNSTSVKGS